MARSVSLTIMALCVFSLSGSGAEPQSLFDGKTLNGWEGDTKNTWRVEDGAIVGGSLEKLVPRNLVPVHDEELWRFRVEGEVQAAR
jgi:hypothetical protein